MWENEAGQGNEQRRKNERGWENKRVRDYEQDKEQEEEARKETTRREEEDAAEGVEEEDEQEEEEGAGREKEDIPEEIGRGNRAGNTTLREIDWGDRYPRS